MINGKKICVSVAGKFHYFSYMRHMVDVVDDFFYSYSVKKFDFGKNLFIKEYMVKGHIKLFGFRGSDLLFPYYHDAWQMQLARNFKNYDIWHFMLHGNNLNLVMKAKNDGVIVLGEAVNTHPKFQEALINKERDYRGLKLLDSKKQHVRLVEEANNSDYILTPSEFVRKSYLANGFSPDRVLKVPFGIDIKKFSKNNNDKKNGKKLRIGCVAQICLRKGQLYLLEAIEKIGFSNIELILVGGFSDDSNILFEKYRDNFTHIPAIAGKDMCNFYNSIDLFVLPTLEEGLALVICEALACGVPVISTTSSGIEDITDDGNGAIILNNLSSDSLAEAIGEFLDDRDYLNEMSRRALGLVESDISWEKYASEIKKLYMNILSIDERI